MDSRENSSRGTRDRLDSHEKRGSEDTGESQARDVAEALGQRDEDGLTFPSGRVGQTSTTKEAEADFMVHPAPAAASVPSTVISPIISNPANYASSQAQLASPSGRILEHLNLDQWKTTGGFQSLRKAVERFLVPNKKAKEASLQAPLLTAINESFKQLVPTPNPSHEYPRWDLEGPLSDLAEGGDLATQPMCQLYQKRLIDEMEDMAKQAGLTQMEQYLSSIRRKSWGPDTPDMVCSADLDTRQVWTYVQEHKINNQTEGLAQILWYLAFAHQNTGCYLGSLIVANRLQRLVMLGSDVWIETTAEATASGSITDFQSLFTHISDFPMPLTLFDKASASVPAAPNDAGLSALLRITARASDLAVQVGIGKLDRVPSAEATLVDELFQQGSLQLAVDLGEALINTHTFKAATSRYRTALNKIKPRESKPNKRKERDDDSEDDRDDSNYKPGSKTSGPTIAKKASRSSERSRPVVSYTPPSSGSDADSGSIQNVLSAWNLAKLPLNADSPVDRLLGLDRPETLQDHQEVNPICFGDSEDVDEVYPRDSGSNGTGTTGISAQWEDQFCSVLPSRIVAVLDAMGYRPVLATSGQLDLLIGDAFRASNKSPWTRPHWTTYTGECKYPHDHVLCPATLAHRQSWGTPIRGEGQQ